tara:strand:- start:2800 stop:3165 length:366 start_codon:yes stop_codon:yes gene_type:complete
MTHDISYISNQFSEYLRFIDNDNNYKEIAPYFIDYIQQKQLPDFILNNWISTFHIIYTSNMDYWHNEISHYDEICDMFQMVDNMFQEGSLPVVLNYTIPPTESLIHNNDEVHVVTDDENDF